MKKQLLVMVILCGILAAFSAQAMVPKVWRGTPKKGVIGKSPKRIRLLLPSQKPKQGPVPVRPYPVRWLNPDVPYYPIKPIIPYKAPRGDKDLVPKVPSKQIFQKISLVPLEQDKEGEETVLILDTSLVPREELLQQMVNQHKGAIIAILEAPVMQLVEKKMRLDLNWIALDDVQSIFSYFNSQIDSLAAYAEQFKGKVCPVDDDYCKQVIVHLNQLQKQLKMYMQNLFDRYTLP